MRPSAHSPSKILPTKSQYSVPALAAFLLLAACLVACGGPDATRDAEASPPAGSSDSGAPASSGIQAAQAAGTVDTQYFTTVLPEGWEILADDISSMGLMTLAETGTGGSQGVYMKFEGGGKFSGQPMQLIEKFASSYDGTPAESETRNGIEWARTRYTYNGVGQSLNITAHDGYKVTFTVMGRDYDEDPGVKAIFDSLQWK